jgi:hypothetical protein
MVSLLRSLAAKCVAFPGRKSIVPSTCIEGLAAGQGDILRASEPPTAPGTGPVGVSCLSGCFSKPPDVVFSKGGWTPTFTRLCGPVALWAGEITGRGRNSRLEGAQTPSKTASVAARLWDLMRAPCGKHHFLGFAETTGQAEGV